jgi:hypothetical protein
MNNADIQYASVAKFKNDMMHVESVKELRALQQLTINGCEHTPRLLDAKVVLYDTTVHGDSVYVTFTLMTFVPGVPLRDGSFWDFPQAKRDVVRRAFQVALRYASCHSLPANSLTRTQ